jgi:putative ATP-dependent endonuclease of OLD family
LDFGAGVLHWGSLAAVLGEEEAHVIIRSVQVQNFRCLKDVEVVCEPLTVLVGPNGAGKSAFLRALELFYDDAAQYDERDFYAEDAANPIVVQVTFTDLTEEELALFAPYVHDGTLSVEKEMSWPRSKTSQKYYGSRLRNADFGRIREAGSATEKRGIHNEVRQQREYGELPAVSRADDIEGHLESWEREHPEALTRVRDAGQFFGFTQVGKARLGRFTRFLLIPAVRDATEDATERRGSVLTDLMELLVRSTLAEREELRELRERTQREYDELMDADRLLELRALERSLSTTLQRFVPNADVELDWHTEKELDLPLPDASVRLEENGYGCEVGRTGHGLQRAFILTILQHLSVAHGPAQAATDSGAAAQPGQSPTGYADAENHPQTEGTETGPNLILGIEEPELYQHPNRQRHWTKVLLQLAEGRITGVADRTQVIYSTHSPLFIDVERFDQIRVLRKTGTEDGRPKCTEVAWAPLDSVARDLEQAAGVATGTFTAQTLRPRLRSFMRPEINEAFFAELAVLVEGQEDKAAILAAASLLNTAVNADLESLGVSFIECGGKTNLDKAIAIMKRLGIPFYAVWDSDKGNQDPHVEVNHRLLRLLGESVEDYPARIEPEYACFECTLVDCLREEIGEEEFESLLCQCKLEFQFAKHRDAPKNPSVMQAILARASQQGKSCDTLTRIVEEILRKRESLSGV